MEEIAAFYIKELVEQNPSGPYAIAGYSFGGYVALEMAQQLKAMGKEVKMLAMFDTNAQESEYHYSAMRKLGLKVLRQFPKAVWFTRSLLRNPADTIRYQQDHAKRIWGSLMRRVGLQYEPPQEEAGFDLISHIVEKHETAYLHYTMKPYDGVIDLFKAQTRLYFVEDSRFLGWKKFARKGVRVHNVPGDHKMMMLPPNDKTFAKVLQKALDNC